MTDTPSRFIYWHKHSDWCIFSFFLSFHFWSRSFLLLFYQCLVVYRFEIAINACMHLSLSLYLCVTEVGGLAYAFDTSVNLDKTFFHSHEQKKGGESQKKPKKPKAKKFRVSSKKVQFPKLYSIGQVPPAQSYCTRSLISEMWDVLRRHFNHIWSLVMSRAAWVSTR